MDWSPCFSLFSPPHGILTIISYPLTILEIPTPPIANSACTFTQCHPFPTSKTYEYDTHSICLNFFRLIHTDLSLSLSRPMSQCIQGDEGAPNPTGDAPWSRQACGVNVSFYCTNHIILSSFLSA